MVALLARWTCWGLVVAVLGTIAGCPSQVDLFSQDAPNPNILHALPPDLTALLNAPPTDAPTAGASALANTDWSGTQNCMITGDINMLISGPGTNPLSDSLYFDERGLPSGTYGTGYQFKRATFTEDSFDLASTWVITQSFNDPPVTVAQVMTLSGKRSADGRTLTGRRRLGSISSVGVGSPVAGFPQLKQTLRFVR